jgi:hypothetical protein
MGCPVLDTTDKQVKPLCDDAVGITSGQSRVSDRKLSAMCTLQEATLEEAQEALQGEHLKTTRVVDL